MRYNGVLDVVIYFFIITFDLLAQIKNGFWVFGILQCVVNIQVAIKISLILRIMGGGDTGGQEFRIGKPGGAGLAPFSNWEHDSMRPNYKDYVSVNEGGQDVQYDWRSYRLASIWWELGSGACFM